MAKKTGVGGMSILGVDGLRSGVLAAMVLLSMGPSAAVMAQEPNPHEHGTEHEHDNPGEHGRKHEHEHDEEAFALQEIIVTAEKRAENLQSTPLAVTAITGEDLKRAGITDARGLPDVVPVLQVGDFPPATPFSIPFITTTTTPHPSDSPPAS